MMEYEADRPGAADADILNPMASDEDLEAACGGLAAATVTLFHVSYCLTCPPREA
jgi:hypothetical protein